MDDTLALSLVTFFAGRPQEEALGRAVTQQLLKELPGIVVQVQKSQITFRGRYGFAALSLPRRAQDKAPTPCCSPWACPSAWTPPGWRWPPSPTPAGGPTTSPWPAPRSWTKNSWVGSTPPMTLPRAKATGGRALEITPQSA